MRVAASTTMLSLLSIGGCALPELADPEAAEYRRVDAQLRAADEYEALKRSCRARGGVVFVDGDSSRLRPRIPDLATARCGAPFSGLSF
jgi:hypothetical protein